MTLRPNAPPVSTEENTDDNDTTLAEPRCSLGSAGGSDRWLAAGCRSGLVIQPHSARSQRSGGSLLDTGEEWRAVAEPDNQYLPRSDWFRYRRQSRLASRLYYRAFPLGRTSARQFSANATKHSASGADPAGDPVVRH